MQEEYTGPFGAPAYTDIIDLSDKYADELNGDLQRIPLPWSNLEWCIGNGLAPGQVSLIYGPPGASKTFFALNILLNAGAEGFSWKFVPLEDTPTEMVERCIAILEGSWETLTTYSRRASDEAREALYRKKEKALAKNYTAVAEYFKKNICSNPMRHEGGSNYREAIRYIESAAHKENLIVIDNMSQISFEDGTGANKFNLEERFMQSVTNAVAGTKCHVMLIAHTRKKQRGDMVADMDSIAGSGHLSRLSQLVLCIEPHRGEDKESQVPDGQGGTKTVHHNITVHVNKVRLGGMSGARVAFQWADWGPVFEERGGIVR